MHIQHKHRLITLATAFVFSVALLQTVTYGRVAASASVEPANRMFVATLALPGGEIAWHAAVAQPAVTPAAPVRIKVFKRAEFFDRMEGELAVPAVKVRGFDQMFKLKREVVPPIDLTIAGVRAAAPEEPDALMRILMSVFGL